MSNNITNIKLATLEKQIEILDKIDSKDVAITEILNTVKVNTSSIIDLLKNSSAGVVKSVQRGTIDSPDKFVDVSIQPVNLDKSIMICDALKEGSTNSVSVLPELISSTVLRLTPNIKLAIINWQVIEFY